MVISKLGDGDVFEFHLGVTAGVDLHCYNTLGGDFCILFYEVGGEHTVDVELVVVAFAADNIRIPAVLFEDVLEGGHVTFDEQFIAAMLIVDAAPPSFADVGLVADDFGALGVGTVLDTGVNHARFVVAADAEQAAKFKVAVFFFGAEVGVGADFIFSIACSDDAIDDRPHLGVGWVDGLPAGEGFAIKNGNSLGRLLGGQRES